MTTKRRKADKLPAAQTTEDAIALLARFAQVDAAIEAENLRAEIFIAELRGHRDALQEPLKAELKALFNQLKPWWAVAHEQLTDGKRKSAELGGCQIGHRTSTPALKLRGLTEADALEHLDALGFDRWAVRTRRELDKPALIAALKRLGAAGPDGELNADGQDAKVLQDLGFAVSQKEEFFIARIPPADPAVETVADTSSAEVR